MSLPNDSTRNQPNHGHHEDARTDERMTITDAHNPDLFFPIPPSSDGEASPGYQESEFEPFRPPSPPEPLGRSKPHGEVAWKPKYGWKCRVLFELAGSPWVLYLAAGYIEFNDKEVLGLCDSESRLIIVSDKLDRHGRWSCFWHELTHAVAFQFNWVLRGGYIHEEAVAGIMEIGFSRIDPHDFGTIQTYLSEMTPDQRRMRMRAMRRRKAATSGEGESL